VFLMQARQWAVMSAGNSCVRFKVLAWGDSHGEQWELPLPARIGADASDIIAQASTAND
jgi:hypothetical protein